MTSRRTWLGVLAALLTVALLWWQQGDGTLTSEAPTPTAPTASDSATPDGVDPDSGLPLVARSALPAEALQTLRLIEAGGPFPYDQDDSVFQNREGILPDRPEGYYREYTVETPGSEDRGARRVVAGAEGERYWTDDHYSSFSTIATTTDTSGG